MTCPLCGEDCRCAAHSRSTSLSPQVPRFEPEGGDPRLDRAEETVLIDPEAYEASEQQFAASLEEGGPRPRFVVEPETAGGETQPGRGRARAPVPTQAIPPQEPGQADLLAPVGFDFWRQEVAARVHSYRARRRPRGPRYPSLRLNFEAEEPARASAPGADEPPAPTRAVGQARVRERVQSAPAATFEARSASAAQPVARAIPVEAPPAETTAKIIRFPRSAGAPPAPLEELAEPVLDRPRIVEAPEVAPPPPALGGITLEPEEINNREKQPGFDIPLQAAARGRRVLALVVDGVLVAAAFALFASIFFKITAVAPPLPQVAGVSAALLGAFWAAYQYLMLVHTGSTPGLKLARLALNRFEGAPADRRLRRWRVLAAVLSTLPLGLGYVWCFFDEDRLCWHDRITRTYLGPKK